MKKHLLWLAFSLMMMPQILNAQTIDLVKDINVTGNSYGVTVQESAAAGNLLFFLSGNQLWRSDGTETGTLMLTDIYSDPDVETSGLVTANGLAFCQFFYNNDLWLFRSDGTKEGTFPLKNSNELEIESKILDVNGSIYFSAVDSGYSTQLWKTDGTVAGTVLVKEISVGVPGAISPFDFFDFNGVLYFLSGVRYNGNETYRLWKSDGTAAGTLPGPAIGGRFKPVSLNGYMYFSENNILKRTDGTTITTVRSFTSLGDPAVAGTTIYFPAQDGSTGTELWKSNGTTAGTVLVKDINTGTNVSSTPSSLTNVNGTLFFSAEIANSNRALWKSNGTAAGTVQVGDLGPVSTTYYVREIISVGNQAVFSVYNDPFGTKIWKSDGTNAGTQVIADFYGNQLTNAGGTVFFNGTETTVSRLYKSNLTVAGTVPVSPLTGPGSFPQKIFDLNGTGYFVADDGINGNELWRTNTTAAGTVIVKDILPGSGSSNPDQLTNVNGTLFFVANTQEIWKSNGTLTSTQLVKDVISGANDRITGLIELNGTLIFGVVTSSQNLQIWRNDGTAAGTVLVTTLPNTVAFSAVKLNGQLYFMAWDGINSYELWKTNGTAPGTSLVKDIAVYGGSIAPPVVAGNYIYYILINIESLDNLLVKSDGTAAGTTVIKNLYPDDEFAYFSRLTAAGNLVYFNVVSDSEGIEVLWRTDGTDAGTIPVGNFDVHYTSDPFIRQKTAVGGKFYFVPYDNEIGDQLWVSDGTPAGTKMVKKIGQFANDFTINQTAGIGDILYFTPHDPATGTELWRSDGTSDGTYLVYDLTTNGSTSFYNELVNVNGTLLITARAGNVGIELYKYKPAPAALRINSGGAAFAASGSRNFSADQYFNGTTQLSAAASGDISNTTDDQLYKEQRFGSAFNYNIPVANGQVNVVLHFAEIYWGVPGKGGLPGAGKRRFHVDIEGSRKLTNYDIFVSAGGAMRAKTETFTVNVTDGTLNIDFLTGAANNPIIAAIEVVPAGPTVLGPLADAYVRNTPNNTANYGIASILEVKTGSIDAYQRNTYLKFPLNGISQVSSARLRIYGSNTQSSSNTSVSAYGVSDDSWTETGITWNNVPPISGGVLGSVNVNNTAKYYEIDVTPFVQSQLAGDKIVSLFVTNPGNQNTQLVFNSRENAVNRPQLVIETVAPPAARLAAEEEFSSSVPKIETSVIYPNPVVGKRFSVKVSGLHEGNVDLQLMNKTGQYLLIQKQPAGANSVIEVDASAMRLSEGMYLLKIESKAHKEVVKMLVLD